MWVRGHQGMVSNEEVDRSAKREVWLGERMCRPDIVTPVGIRQAFLLHPKPTVHIRWARTAIWGLTYLVMDKGPQLQWMRETGKTDDPA